MTLTDTKSILRPFILKIWWPEFTGLKNRVRSHLRYRLVILELVNFGKKLDNCALSSLRQAKIL